MGTVRGSASHSRRPIFCSWPAAFSAACRWDQRAASVAPPELLPPSSGGFEASYEARERAREESRKREKKAKETGSASTEREEGGGKKHYADEPLDFASAIATQLQLAVSSGVTEAVDIITSDVEPALSDAHKTVAAQDVEKRKKLIRKLQLKYHPDKASSDSKKEVAKIVFQFVEGVKPFFLY